MYDLRVTEKLIRALTKTSAVMGLKGIPDILSPELIYALAQMGHGDELVLADANFPAR